MPESSPSQLINAWQTAAKNKDANTLKNYYASNAVLCATEGIISGNSDISGDFAAQFQGGFVLAGISNQSINPGPPPPGTTTSNWAWAYGQWSGSAPNPKPPPPTTLQLAGSWSILLVNQATSGPANWLIQQHTIVTNLS